VDTIRLREAAERLEREVAGALAAGYENADCVLTSEIRELLPLAKAGRITEPVRLQFTAGPAWNFFETRLGECVQLQSAWHEFRWLIEDQDSDPLVQADRGRSPRGYEA
jgi:hypothetical protein